MSETLVNLLIIAIPLLLLVAHLLVFAWWTEQQSYEQVPPEGDLAYERMKANRATSPND
ncbi:MAG: hypothetical protein AAFQ07_10375 [Chloroflexota bacterium]